MTKFDVTQKCQSIGRHFLWQKEISCHMKKFIFTRRISVSIGAHLISKDVDCLSPVENSCCKKEILSRSNVFPVMCKKWRKTCEFLDKFRVSSQDFVGNYIPISQGISHPGEITSDWVGLWQCSRLIWVMTRSKNTWGCKCLRICYCWPHLTYNLAFCNLVREGLKTKINYFHGIFHGWVPLWKIIIFFPKFFWNT